MTHRIVARSPFRLGAWLSGLALLLALPALAGETVAGVEFPATKTVAGQELKLNGAGLRTRVVQLYAAGLYLEEPSESAEEIIASDQIKRVELHMLRDLTRQQVAQTIVQGVERNAVDQMPALEDRLQRLVNHIPDLDRGETLTVTYVPGTGTIIDGETITPLTIPGEDFGDAIFAVWLGTDPVQASLKSSLAGQA
jgi:hypothetical protein